MNEASISLSNQFFLPPIHTAPFQVRQSIRSLWVPVVEHDRTLDGSVLNDDLERPGSGSRTLAVLTSPQPSDAPPAGPDEL